MNMMLGDELIYSQLNPLMDLFIFNMIRSPTHSLKAFGKKALKYRAMTELITGETRVSRPLRVSIEGNVGCGKSTLIKYFKNFDDIDAKAEPLDEWRNVQGHNLLHLLYADQSRWNFTFQLYVQLSRLNLQTTQSDKKIQLFERSLQNSRHCFVEMAYHRGYLADLEYATLSEWYDWLEKNMDINLDLIVYLRSSPDVVYNRMLQRNRPEESSVSLEYLTDLHKHYESWLMEGDPASLPAPVIVLNVDKDIKQVTQMYRKLEQYLLERNSISEGRFEINLSNNKLCF